MDDLESRKHMGEAITTRQEDAEADKAPWMKLNLDGIDTPVKELKEIRVTTEKCETETRLFYPEGEGPFPVVLQIHGGAFVGGFNAMDEPIDRQICHGAGAIVISPNYHLAPDYKWPYALEELYALLRYFKAHAAEYDMDFSRLAVGGASAGAWYAAALCVKASREKDITFRHLNLFYPELSVYRKGNEKWVTPYTDTVAMPPAQLDALSATYLPEEAVDTDPLVSPIEADASCFPATCIFAGTRDIFWKGAREFVGKLQDADREVLFKTYAGSGHGFLELAGREDLSRDSIRLLLSDLKKNL